MSNFKHTKQRENGHPGQGRKNGTNGAVARKVICQGPPDKTVPRARVLLVHRSAVLRIGVRSLLAGSRRFVLEAQTDDAAHASALFLRDKPDAVVVGLQLRHGADGVILVRDLMKWRPGLATVVLTQREDFLSCERAMRAGALGYIHLQDQPRELLRALEEALAGRHYASPTTMRHLLRLTARKKRLSKIGVARLSERELQVFRLIASGVTTTPMARQLHMSVKTVETHYMRIKLKLGFGSSEELKHAACMWQRRQNGQRAVPI